MHLTIVLPIGKRANLVEIAGEIIRRTLRDGESGKELEGVTIIPRLSTWEMSHVLAMVDDALLP